MLYVLFWGQKDSPAEKKKILFPAVIFCQFLVIKTLDLDLDPDRYLAKMLDPDPDLINPEPQHCGTTRRSFVKHTNFFPDVRLNQFILLIKLSWRSPIFDEFVMLLLEKEEGMGGGG